MIYDNVDAIFRGFGVKALEPAKWQSIEFKANGLTSYCVQHEPFRSTNGAK